MLAGLSCPDRFDTGRANLAAQDISDDWENVRVATRPEVAEGRGRSPESCFLTGAAIYLTWLQAGGRGR